MTAMGDKKKSGKKKSDHSVVDTVTANVGDVGTAIAAPIEVTIAAIEAVGGNTKNAVEDIAADVADAATSASAGAQHLVADTTKGTAGAVQAVIDKVQPDGKSSKKSTKKNRKKDTKKSKKK